MSAPMSPPDLQGHSHADAKSLTRQLTKTKLFQDYQSAFESATGLPLYLHEAGNTTEGLSSRPGANPFCLLMAQNRQACAACHALQQKLEHQPEMGPRSLQCFAGLCESAVPVRVRGKIIAFLQTGQILLHRPEATQFSKVAQTLIEMGSGIDLKTAGKAWFASTVLKEPQYESMLRLLHIFAGHLAGCAHALSPGTPSGEPRPVTKAKAIVMENSAEVLSLGRVAKAVNVSAGYFSGLFHEATGLTFTEYVARIRVEKVKSLLTNPKLQITTIAYETGFKSLSQFNRVFRRVCGISPREYRLQLPGAAGT